MQDELVLHGRHEPAARVGPRVDRVNGDGPDRLVHLDWGDR